MLETGDFGGDKLSGLTRYVEEPRRADVASAKAKVAERQKTAQDGKRALCGCGWQDKAQLFFFDFF